MTSTADLMSAVNKSAKRQVGGIDLQIPDPVRLPSDIFALDLATGGGFPIGRCSYIVGLEASMKTTLLLKLVASHQRMFPDKRCMIFDVEHHLLQSWAEVFGVDWGKLMVIRPNNAEHLVDIIEGMMVADDIGLIGIDSIAAMVTQRELDQGAETQNVGGSGLVVNKLYRKVTRGFAFAEDKKLTPTVIAINQTRYKIGVMYGSPETAPGGVSFKFMSSLSLRVGGSDEYLSKTDKLPSYKKITVQITKNKVPILSKNCKYMIALRNIPELGLKLGGSYDWGSALLYLKKLSLLVQVKDGWELKVGAPVIYPTQDALKERYIAQPEFGAKIRAKIITTALVQGDPITETDDDD
jgi:recombination protein RecA